MSAFKRNLYIAASICILGGSMCLCRPFGTQGNQVWIFLGMIFIGIGLGLLYFAYRERSTVTPQEERPIQGEVLQEVPQKRRSHVFIISLSAITLVILACCILVMVDVGRSFSPKTKAMRYRDASIIQMLESCS